MNRDTFYTLVVNTNEQIQHLSATKGADYASEADVCLNFKRAAERQGLTPEQIWATYWGKHVDAIFSYCRNGQVESEPVQSRIQDAILYLHLLNAMLQDAQCERTRIMLEAHS